MIAACLPTFFACLLGLHFSFCRGVLDDPLVVIFAYNRVFSLKRLVTSINASLPLTSRIDLYICCDNAKDESHNATTDYVRSLSWNRGTFQFLIHKTPVGLTEQWMHCWNSELIPRENVVLLEDDLEVSPYALQWLASARRRYANDNSVIGFSFQRQTNCFHVTDCENKILSMPWSLREYKNLLVGSWGYAPVRSKWQSFRTWYTQMSQDKNYVPTIDYLLPSQWYRDSLARGKGGSMWTMWVIKYCDLFQLYHVYYQHYTSHTLCSHWAEPGLHYSGPAKIDFELLRTSPSIPLLPSNVSVSWNGRFDAKELELYEISNLIFQLRGLLQPPLITFLNYGFLNMLEHFLCNLKDEAPELLPRLCIVAMDDRLNTHLLQIQKEWNFSVVGFGNFGTASQHVLFNTVGYNKLILHRTRAINYILQANLSILMVESDSFIQGNFADSFVFEDPSADIVGIRDTFDRPMLNGGFILMRSSARTRAVWSTVLSGIENEMMRFRGQIDNAPAIFFNEQDILSDLINKGAFGVRAATLNRQRFLSGQIFLGNQRNLIANAEVVLLNNMVGNVAKSHTAQKYGLWYSLHEKTCVRSLPLLMKP